MLQLVLGRDAGVDRDLLDDLRSSSVRADAAAELPPVTASRSLRRCPARGRWRGRQRVVAGDHDRADAGRPAGRHGGLHLGPRRVDHADQADETQVALDVAGARQRRRRRPSGRNATPSTRMPGRARPSFAAADPLPPAHRRAAPRRSAAQTRAASVQQTVDGALGEGHMHRCRSTADQRIRAARRRRPGGGPWSCACGRSRTAPRPRAALLPRRSVLGTARMRAAATTQRALGRIADGVEAARGRRSGLSDGVVAQRPGRQRQADGQRQVPVGGDAACRPRVTVGARRRRSSVRSSRWPATSSTVTVMRFSVRVPVLSEQMTVTDPASRRPAACG